MNKQATNTVEITWEDVMRHARGMSFMPEDRLTWSWVKGSVYRSDDGQFEIHGSVNELRHIGGTIITGAPTFDCAKVCADVWLRLGR